jgi:PiT family inorganic phosphate transporter
MMFAVCLCSFIFIMTSSFSGMPISGTHTVVGALIGAGIIGVGFNDVNWPKLASIVSSWFISPVFTGVLSFILMVLVSRFTLDT